MAPSLELATHYERLREQVVGSGNGQTLGMTVLLRQGLWAWMLLVAAQPADGASDARVGVPSLATSLQSPLPSHPPATVRHELVAAWTNLVVGASHFHQEVHP